VSALPFQGLAHRLLHRLCRRAGKRRQTSFQAALDNILITTGGTPNQLIKAVNVGGGQFTSSSRIV